MSRIPEEELERLDRDVSLQQLVEAHGVVLKGSGDNLLGLCPFHDDKSALAVPRNGVSQVSEADMLSAGREQK